MYDVLLKLHTDILLLNGESDFYNSDDKISIQFDINGYIGMVGWWPYSSSLNIEYLDEESGEDVLVEQNINLSHELSIQKIDELRSYLKMDK